MREIKDRTRYKEGIGSQLEITTPLPLDPVERRDEWHRAVLNGDTQRRVVTVTLLDPARQPVARWRFVEAWPAKWQGPELNAQSSEVLIETLEIVHEGMELD